MQQSIARIADLVSKLEINNNYYSNRETVHRNSTFQALKRHFFSFKHLLTPLLLSAAESTNSRVVWWSVFETVFVLLIAGGQVFYLRTKVNRSNMGKRRV